MITKYIEKKEPVEAVQLNWKNWSDVCEILGDQINENNPARMVNYFEDDCGEIGPDYIEITVSHFDGLKVRVRHGDWIIKSSKGRIYTLHPSDFQAYNFVPYEESDDQN